MNMSRSVQALQICVDKIDQSDRFIFGRSRTFEVGIRRMYICVGKWVDSQQVNVSIDLLDFLPGGIHRLRWEFHGNLGCNTDFPSSKYCLLTNQ